MIIIDHNDQDIIKDYYSTTEIQWNLYSSFSSEVWKRNNGSGKTIDTGAMVEIKFAQGPQKLNDGSRKTNYLGTIDRGFTVYCDM
jgi:hypothetical protein